MWRTPKSRPVYWLPGLPRALGALSLAAVGLLAVRIDRVGEPAFVFLTWNLFLAWIPFVLSLCVAAVHSRGGPRPLLWVLGAGWLLFLPNAPYILTDFIHLGRVGGAPLWVDDARLGNFAGARGPRCGVAPLFAQRAVHPHRLHPSRKGGRRAAVVRRRAYRHLRRRGPRPRVRLAARRAPRLRGAARAGRLPC